MYQKKQSKLTMIVPIILSVMLITGCSAQNKASADAGTGVVTETTMTDTVESSGSVSAPNNWPSSPGKPAAPCRKSALPPMTKQATATS